MRKEARAARQDEIEAAAYDVLEQKGFEGLSMLAVAKAAKASNETLYRWYGDKAGLLEALIARNAGIVKAALDAGAGEGGEACGALARIGPVLLAMLTGPRAVALNRAAAADGSGALGRALARSGRDAVAPWIAGVMARAITAGELAGGTPQEMAELWFGLLIGDVQLRVVTGATPGPGADEIERRAQQALDRLRQIFRPC
jgi:AcrR family transcriptional regulator